MKFLRFGLVGLALFGLGAVAAAQSGAINVTAAQWATAGRGVFSFTTGGPTSQQLPALVGTVTVTGNTPVTVTNTNVTATSMIFFALKTPGGTVGAIPIVQSKTAATSFAVNASASDTSTYYYILIP